MCGRFSLGVDTDRLIAEFGITTVAEPHQPRYNLAPTQPVPAVVRGDDGLRLGALRWGLVPYWADDPSIGSRMINARSETVAEKPAFREPFRHRRCWVLADGFYEWQEEAGQKVPVHFHRPGREPFAFAGLWDRWGDGDDRVVSCTLLTTEPNEAVRPVHDRMPVILPTEDRDRWLDPDADPAALERLLAPYPGPLGAHRVSTRVNSPANDDPSLIEPISP
ncbi:MAG: SOS response-associated peptidase [Longimicrobiales bacterium]